MEEMGQFMDPAEVQMAMGPAMVMMELFTPEFMQRFLGPTAWEMTAHSGRLRDEVLPAGAGGGIVSINMPRHRDSVPLDDRLMPPGSA